MRLFIVFILTMLTLLQIVLAIKYDNAILLVSSPIYLIFIKRNLDRALSK